MRFTAQATAVDPLGGNGEGVRESIRNRGPLDRREHTKEKPALDCENTRHLVQSEGFVLKELEAELT
jgi:hypothetical protein